MVIIVLESRLGLGVIIGLGVIVRLGLGLGVIVMVRAYCRVRSHYGVRRLL